MKNLIPSYNIPSSESDEETQIKLQKPLHLRRRRWDVTPELRNEFIHLENDSKTSPVIKDGAPIVNNIVLSDSVLDKLLPSGYIKASKQLSLLEDSYYLPPSTDKQNQQAMQELIVTEAPDITGLQFYRRQDEQYFGKLTHLKLLTHPDNHQKQQIKVVSLLLKIKNGSPAIRKRALRTFVEETTSFGPEIIFDEILPLLKEPSLEDQERHVLVKLIGRVLFRLDHLIRPYTGTVLKSISPMLMEEDFTLRTEARDVIAGTCRAAGLAAVLMALKPDLSLNDDQIRHIMCRILAIVAQTFGMANFVPFLTAVIRSKNWSARHIGIRTIHQLCVQLGGGNGSFMLPYLTPLMDLLKVSISDEIMQIRIATANCITQLAENVYPYGIESFEPMLEPLWVGVKRHRGRALGAFLKTFASVIPLMVRDINYEEYSNYYTREVVGVISRELGTQDDEMKATVLRVLMKLPLSKPIIKNYPLQLIRPVFKYFWNRRLASDTKVLYKLVSNGTSELAWKLDYLMVLEQAVLFTKDDNEQLRKLAVDTITKIITTKPEDLVAADSRFEIQLVDGVLYAFQKQKSFSTIHLQGLIAVVKTLGIRIKPHINSILSTVLYQLRNEAPEVRQQAALLIAGIAPVIKTCTIGDSTILQKLILILYESLGEVYPEVLAALLSGLHSCLECFNNHEFLELSNPSINQLLPALSPILKNRHEKVQQATILIIGLIARKGAEVINAREWMRICFDLLDTFKSPKKRIRVSANSTFGDIARTIGPQDIITMLLNNLRVQERQLRVSTAVAIGIVAEICGPFTVLPAIMNEYRTPDNNVQNGVLKALSFLFEYINGTMTRDYLYAITPMVQHALTDRDYVHRQTAATVVKHMALNCHGVISDTYVDVFVHYLNLLMPNMYETSPHVINRILEAIDAIRVVIGYGRFMNYVWGGLFHPAKRVRGPYWKVYNQAYVHLADAMVPYYPRMEAQEDDVQLQEFDLFL